MFKKIAIFGFAMGSAAASMHLIYFFNGLYKSQSLASVLPLLGNVVFSGLGVYLFIKSLLRDSETPPNMGKTLFGSLLTAFLISVCIIGALQYVHENKPDTITEFKKMSFENQKMLIQKSFPEKEWNTKYEEAQKTIDTQLGMRALSISMIQMCLSTGLVVALIVFLRNFKRS